MPRRKTETDETDDQGSPVADQLYDTLRGAGCYKLDSVRRKNGGYTLTTWMTSGRRIILVKVMDGGAVSFFEEVSQAQLEEVLKSS